MQHSDVRTVAGQRESVLATNKVLRNTYLLLAMTLVFSAMTAGVAMAINAPYGIGLVCSLVALGLLWFVVPRTAHSINGIYAVFAVTGLLGFGLGPILNAYLTGFSNGGQIVMMALGMTGATFVGLSAYALKSRKDFSFMRQALFAGILIAFIAAMGMMVFSLFGMYFQPLALAISAAFTVLMCGLILYQTGEIVNGGETNYILATIGLYVAIYNLFTSLLHLLGFAMGED
ncbi:Bax inhibitor-1/YccA family protein [Algiphilus sp.]|uniref:Bax inhibitor-1/YccA family protein n=1 Tax=Algiphilus sp. TaxID=1872431 RepID=UPI001CA75F11|nr:Bax inhibitor-1/YccA family protein [Algiphilus sp.]MBY8964799.1 Bax inhibitor-1/YccA family protein [Algiphilus acroporae]MCI5063226.1 Bax inhibitor-1/YccA family protein [Algiphilus sp.]MCI5103942.1 Bax inhibitor-1/YccA family protein [Algiphilus sp.]MCR9091037.1 Bax inhibitor-1/YccA family protein [Pseudomonadota bacterium]